MYASKLMIFGNGPAALSLALGCQALGFDIELVRQHPHPRRAKDPRAWAFRPASLDFLADLGLPLGAKSPLTEMAISHGDREGNTLPGKFSLKTKTAMPLGAILPNAPLRKEFENAVFEAGIPIHQVADAALPNPLALTSEAKAALALICDPAWQAALPKAQQPVKSRWAYDQIAATAPVFLNMPHEGIARQVFLPSGPLALLPLPDPYQASLVWSLTKSRWAGLQHRPDLQAMISRCVGINISLNVDDLVTFPLTAEHASTYVGAGFAILGEAAHRIHPLAGQGLNLGLADVGALLDTLIEARSVGADLGSPYALEGFERRRRPLNEAMRASTDQLKLLFGTDFGPVRFARAMGLGAFDASPLKTKLLDWMLDQTPLSQHLTAKSNRRVCEPPQAT